MIAPVAVPGLRMRPVRVSARGDAAAALCAAAHARLKLAGQARGGFWAAPHGRNVILVCHRQNLARAKALRLAG